jgi:dipeptidyl aminopeptidase/acylaminoacyl peptidase
VPRKRFVSLLDFDCLGPQHGTFAYKLRGSYSRSKTTTREIMERKGIQVGMLCVAALAAKTITAQTSAESVTKTQSEAMRAMFEVHTFKQAAISPDGKRVAWVEDISGPGEPPSSHTAIYVAAVSAPDHVMQITAAEASTHDVHADGRSANKEHVPRTRAKAHDATAREEHDVAWSPDSEKIAFLSDAQTRGQLQLFVVDASGTAAKPRRLTHFKGFVSDPRWSPDGKMIALLYTENASRAAGPLVAETPDEGVISDSYVEQRLTLVDRATGNARAISPPDMYVYEFDWSPDSSRLVATGADGNGDDNWYIASLFSIESASGSLHTILKTPGMQIANPRWSPDGQQIAFIGGLMSDEGVTGGDVFAISAEGAQPQNITPGMSESASSLDWAPNSRRIVFAGIRNGETIIDRVSVADKAISRLWRGAEKISDGPVPEISLSLDGKVSAVIRQSFLHPPEVWAGPVGEWKAITKSNSALAPAWGKAESRQWATEIGVVQGWLVYPTEFDPAKKYPLVVVVHGGPASASMPAWPSRWTYYMALPAEGYFLLFPNPRGSYGAGEKFTAANVKDFGYGDWVDILAGVDKAIQSAPIDSDRLGITGWSYGGYMTMWGVTQTNRFRSAVAGAGLADWLSYYGENKIDQWMIPYFGASVYDDPAVYAKSAPINYVKNVKTPTLIVVGDRDGECPAPQSFEFWHALKTLRVPTQFVVYPNEGHRFADPAHSRDLIERTNAWFNQYLQAVQ